MSDHPLETIAPYRLYFKQPTKDEFNGEAKEKQVVDTDAPKDFLIGYTHADQRWAEWIAWHLEEAGYHTKLQAWDFFAGSNFVLEMDAAARQATRTIVVLSPDYFTFQITPSEWAAAFRRDPTADQGRLLPIRVRPCDVEGQLGQIIYIDLVDRDEATARARLLQGVTHEQRKPSSPPIFPSEFHTSQSSKRPSYPGALPAIWNIPHPRNPYFTGREELLRRLAASLRAGETVGISQPQAVHGLGGVGKSQIALEYAYRYYQDYDAVLWTRADTQEALISGFVVFASLLELPVQEERDQLKIVQAVKHWLTSHTRWLLILDNADDLALVRDFLPPAGRGHTLLTTRAASMGRLAHPIEVDTLDVEPGALLLLRRADLLAPDALLEQAEASERATALQITHELGGLPLALDQAGAYIEETLCSLADYLHLYRIHRADLLKERGGLVSDHPQPVATTWSLSFVQVQERSNTAADLLRVCAFLYPDAIPEEIFTDGAAELGPNVQAVAQNPLVLNQAIGVLLSYSLLKRQPEEHLLSMNRLVQAVLKDGMNEDTQVQWAERVVRVVNQRFPNPQDVATWPRCQLYLPHAMVCAALIQQWDMTFTQAVLLLNQTGSYLNERAQYVEAETLMEHAVAINERILGPSHLDLATNYNNLALLYHDQGKYELSEALLQRALAIREKVLESNHPKIAMSLNNLATHYYNQGEYQQAEPLYQRALSINEQILGPNHPGVATNLNNLAELYRIQGKYEQAEPLYQRALTIREQSLDSHHPDVAQSLNNLAGLYIDQGKYDQAESLYQRALSINEQILGPNHPGVAINLNNLAELYRIQGKYEQAEPLYQRALAIFEQTLGPDHPNVAQSLNNLALLNKNQGKYEQAEPLYQRALAIFEQKLGPNHPNVAQSLNNLALLYRIQGKYEQAEILMQRAITIRQQNPDPSHIDLVRNLNNLALLYKSQGKYEQAEPLYQRALAIREQRLGQNHPDVAQSLNNQAVLSYQQGEYEQAEHLYQRALSIFEQTLGPNHPNIAYSLNNLAALNYQQGEYEQAEHLYQRALSIFEQALGPNHPVVSRALENYAILLQKMKRNSEATNLQARAKAISAKGKP
jgi:tetratricopeptide (TPR) repeat protein